MNKKLRKIIYPILLLFTLYIIGGMVLARRQDQFIFKPVPLDSGTVFKSAYAHKVFNIPVQTGETLNILYLYQEDAQGQVLYFGNNAGNIAVHLSDAVPFLQRGYNVFMVDYPGYGKSTGQPTEQSLNQSAEILYQLAGEYMAPDRTILYGKGLGGAVAAYLAARRPCKAVLLRSPFYDLLAMAHRYFPIYPVKKYLHYQFPVYHYLRRTQAPVILFHGEKDRIIPFAQAVALKAALAPKDRLVALPEASHANVEEQKAYRQVLDSVLAD